MTRQEADAARILKEKQQVEDRLIRLGLLAQLAEHPAWGAFKELLAHALAVKPVDFSDPQWHGRLTHQHGQSELALHLVRAVENAPEELKKKRQEQADA